MILAGHGAARSGAADALLHFSELLSLRWRPLSRQRRVPRRSPHSLGAVGFMSHDYVNFGFDEADVIVSVGYELQEFDPSVSTRAGQADHPPEPRPRPRWMPVTTVEVGIQADIPGTLAALGQATTPPFRPGDEGRRSGDSWPTNSRQGRRDAASAQASAYRGGHRPALGRADIVLADTGAVKMWMARLYPTSNPTRACLQWPLDDGLRPARRDRRQARRARSQGACRRRRRGLSHELPGIGNGPAGERSFYRLDLGGRRLWPDQLEDGPRTRSPHRSRVSNPDFVAYAESFGAKGYRVGAPATSCPC